MAGRKGKYEYWLTDDGLLLLSAWARDGLTDEQIAGNIGVNRGTLREWKKQFPTIATALKKGKEIADIEVENALFKRATGYRYKEIITETRVDMDGNPYDYVRTVEKEMPPDVTAQIFWLKNRKPKNWRDKPPEDAADRQVTVTIMSGDGYAD